ncbi:MAG: DUF3179 domain-containing protein [Gemmatimonadetes bacterium]|nr:DUF3179 domain-containing protein [Gemmatimonadota bacterium]NNM06241.1 DUF3179 domain-containing protein [Gemmatimonadota bacterium]
MDCSIPPGLLFNGGPGKDGIPALTNPLFVAPGDSETDYLEDSDRVVGIILDDQPLALPLNIFWWHEIVNLTEGGSRWSITHCPLTGSTLGFDRTAAAGAEFGVSGLLYQNNLVMYDRNSDESLWPQMSRGARCGTADGTDLAMIPVIEMTWEGWRTLHPETRVIADTGERNYRSYPYGDYANINNPTLLFPGTVDDRRPPKERVLGIPSGTGGVTYPYGALDELGPVATVEGSISEVAHVVFWDRNREAAMAFLPRLEEQDLTFSVMNGTIVDDQTGSTWRVDGVAVEGPNAGKQLAAVAEAFIAFWFAWPAFYPDVEIWSTS